MLDDLTLVHQLNNVNPPADNKLFKPEDTYRMTSGGFFELPPNATLGQNPPGGVVVHYYLKDKPGGEITLEFLDASGKSIRKFKSKPSSTGDAAAGNQAGGESGDNEPCIPSEAGANRFVWNMRYPDASRFPGLILWAANTQGPRIVPGKYQAQLTVGGRTLTETFEVKADPRITTTPADFARQLDLLLKIRDKVSETHDAINNIREARKQIAQVTDRVKDRADAKNIAEAAKTLNAKLTAVEEELYQTKLKSGQDPLNYPIKLNNKLAAVGGVVSSADTAPTTQSYAVYEELTARIDAQLKQLDEIMRVDMQAFNRLVRERDIPAVVVKTAGANPR